MDGTNITKFAKDTAVYQCAVYNELNERLTGAEIHLKVNGIEYTRVTDNEGLARLNIRLWTGDYTIRAWFTGTTRHMGSSVENEIHVIMNSGTKAKVEEKAEGQIESKIYVGGYPDASGGVLLAPNVMQQLDDFIPDGITFTDYEITETDRRTKTAKFTTPQHLDLTSYFTYVVITSPYHEDFGGVILSIDYDADKDLYTYQCQDWRRQYLTKGRVIVPNETIKKYDFIESTIILPFTTGTINIPLSTEQKKQYAYALSGLRPLQEYNVRVGALKALNYLDRPLPTLLSYDSHIDKIFNVALSSSNNLDIWFDKFGVIHLDPIDWDYWLNTGLLLTTENIAEYKYGFDTTNILTGVRVKNADNSGTHIFYNNYTYDGDTVGKKVSDDLAIIFGKHNSVIDGPKTSTTTTSTGTTATTSETGSTTASNIMNGKKTFVVGCDDGTSTSKLNDVINALKAKGHDCISVGRGPSVITNYGLKSASKGKIAIFICNGIDGGNFYDFVQSYYHYDFMILMYESDTATTDKWLTCNGMKNTKLYIDPRQGYNSKVYNSGVQNYTAYQWCTEKYPNKLAYVCGPLGCKWSDVLNNLINGKFNGGGVATSSNTTTSNNGTATQPAVDVNSPDYIASQYRLAVKEYSKSVRSLMKFSIKVPLNHPVYKNLHTNSFLFTDLPENFALVNLPKIYKNLASYSVSRGVPYAKNRWYVEGVKIKCDSKGLFADITLNAFPSDQSSFASAMEGYISAYDSAFNSTSNTTTTSTTNTSTSNIPARTDGKTDCSTTHSLSCCHTGSSSNPSNKGYETPNAYGKIGKEGTNYAEFVKGCTPKEAYKKLAKKHNYSNYVGYSDNRHSCASNTLNASTSNCGDRARLLKACMDVLGQPCVIYHVYNHYMNGVLINGKWETVDLCYQSGSKPQYQTAGWNK